MVKSLINKLKKGIKKAVLVGIAATSLGGFSACQFPIDNPTNPPTPKYSLDLSAVESELNDVDEETNKVISLPYEDSEGHFVTYTSITPNDPGKFKVFNVDGYNLELEGNKDITGNYGVNIKFVIKGQEKNADLEGKIHNFPDVSGNLQDNETDSGQQGIVRVYDSIGNPLPTDQSDGEGNIQTDSEGNFDFQINTRASNLSDIILQTRAGTKTTPTSYIRTAHKDNYPILQNTDSDNFNPNVGIIRVVPYETEWTQTDKDNFKEHMDRVNFSKEVNYNPSHGLKKWNYGEFSEIPEQFEGIQVSSDDFTYPEYLVIKNAIEESGHLKAEELNIEYGTGHLEDYNWGTIYKNFPAQTFIADTNANGYIDGFITYLNGTIDSSKKALINHEVAGHGLTYPGHASEVGVPELFESIMKYTSPIPDSFTPIDVKGNYVVDENTYRGMEKLDDVLGMNWKN